MKQKTKQRIIAIFIVLIFGMSSIAFVVSSFGGHGGGVVDQQQQFTPLENYVVNGDIDEVTQSVYMQNGFTFLQFYYSDVDELYTLVDAFPDIFVTPTGERQLIVQKIESSIPSAIVMNAQFFEPVENFTDEGLFIALCQNLLFTPTDCLLSGISPGVGGADNINIGGNVPQGGGHSGAMG